MVRLASNTQIPDAPSGFRAFSREAALKFNVFNEYTYTLETIIQAGQRGMRVASVPIQTNADLRPSRLVKSIPSYVQRSLFTILRIFMTYRPMRFFLMAGTVPFSVGFFDWSPLVDLVLWRHAAIARPQLDFGGHPHADGLSTMDFGFGGRFACR